MYIDPNQTAKDSSTRTVMEVISLSQRHRNESDNSMHMVTPYWTDPWNFKQPGAGNDPISAANLPTYEIYTDGFSSPFVSVSVEAVAHSLRDPDFQKTYQHLKPVLTLEVNHSPFGPSEIDTIASEFFQAAKAPFLERTMLELDDVAMTAIRNTCEKFLRHPATIKAFEPCHSSGTSMAIGRVRIVKIAEYNNHVFFMVIFGGKLCPPVGGMFNLPMKSYVRVIPD